jgi:hypothetical protein
VGAGAAADLAVAYASSGAAATAAVEIVTMPPSVPSSSTSVGFVSVGADLTSGHRRPSDPGRRPRRTASSGLPVSFGVASGSASISGGTI